MLLILDWLLLVELMVLDKGVINAGTAKMLLRS